MPKSFEQISAVTPIRTNQRRVRKNDDTDEPMKKKQKANRHRSNGKGEKESLVRINEDNVIEYPDARCPDGCPDKTKVDMIKIVLEMEDLKNSEYNTLISTLKNILHPENVSSRYGENIKQEIELIEEEPIVMNPEGEANPVPVVMSKHHRVNNTPSPSIRTPTSKETIKRNSKVSSFQMINCLFCSEKGGKNLSGYDALRYHVSVCLYFTGAYVPFLPHRQGQESHVMGEIEEWGRQFKYSCLVGNCEKSLPKSKAMGYREFCMHMGSHHGILERWAKECDKYGAQELYHALKKGREEAGLTIPENPNYEVEEVHTCLFCHGEGDGGKELLSFAPAKIKSTRYHYASCLFDFGNGVYLEKYKPVPENIDADGTINDPFGRKFKYTCDECPSKKPRPMGYKEFTTHMAHQHGGLEEILSIHEDEKVRQLVQKIRN